MLPVWSNRKQCNGLGRQRFTYYVIHFPPLIKPHRYKSATKIFPATQAGILDMRTEEYRR